MPCVRNANQKKHANWSPKSAKENTGRCVRAVRPQRARLQVQDAHPAPHRIAHPVDINVIGLSMILMLTILEKEL